MSIKNNIMSGFICGKTIKDNSIPIKKLIGGDKLISKSGFKDFMDAWVSENSNLFCKLVKDNCNVTPSDTTKPTVSYSTPNFPKGGGTVSIKPTVTDQDANLSYEWSTTCTESQVTFSSPSSKDTTITTVNPSPTDSISCEISLKVCDSSNNCTITTKTITIPPKTASPTGKMSVECEDTNANGKYDKAVTTLTINQDVATPSGWTKVTNRSFTRTYTANGTKTVTFSNENGSGTASINISCIGKDSGQGMELPNGIEKNGDKLTVNPSGGSGNYTYVWEVSPNTCYTLTGSGNSRTVECISNPTETCTQARVKVTVSDGNNSVVETTNVDKSCQPIVVEPTVVINKNCIDTNAVGFYDTAKLELTTDGDITGVTSSNGNWVKVNNRKYTLTVTNNGTYDIAVTYQGGSKTYSSKITCIGQSSGIDVTNPTAIVTWGDVNQTVGGTQTLSINATDDTTPTEALSIRTYVKDNGNCATITDANTATPTVLFKVSGDSNNRCIICVEVIDAIGNMTTECMGYIVSDNYTFNANLSSVPLSCDGDATTIVVNSTKNSQNQTYNITSKPSWATVNKEANGIIVSASKNN